jgi:hypothetical protein
MGNKKNKKMIESKKIANALLKDYKLLKQQIDEAKVDDWRYPNNYWSKTLTNIMHQRSNRNTLLRRMERPEFKTASDFDSIKSLSQHKQKELLLKFVPGGQSISKERKVDILLNVIINFETKGIGNIFSENSSKVEIINTFVLIDGISNKMARNIPMDLYHPQFRNGSIPIDANWKKLGKLLGYRWYDSAKDEDKIIDWRNKYIGRDIIAEDWEFDRLVYNSLNDSKSFLNQVIENR